jgi:DNA-binding NtrC family response regulator
VGRLAPGVPILAYDPAASVETAVTLAHLGVHQFLPDMENARRLISGAMEDRCAISLAHLGGQLERADWERMMVGSSHEMRQLQHIIRLVASRRATVLITGETGTGKELAARALHLAGIRRNAPMVAVNCSALPETLLESELFGHVRGAYTGAFQNRTGRFEQAQGGTLFLDEIGELPMDLQTKLLRVLQEREIQRLGSSETTKVDIRVVAATNCNLPRRIEQGKFREDLFYRLNVVPIDLPPLRERKEDIPDLVEHFLEQFNREFKKKTKGVTDDAMACLTRHDWPGNVRELRNVIERVMILEDRAEVDVADLPEDIVHRQDLAGDEDVVADPSGAETASAAGLIRLPEAGVSLRDVQFELVRQALERTGGNQTKAAQLLRISRDALRYKMKSFGLV